MEGATWDSCTEGLEDGCWWSLPPGTTRQDQRIAELEAEVERLTAERDEAQTAEVMWHGVATKQSEQVERLTRLGDRLLFCLDHCRAPRRLAAVTLEDVTRAKSDWLAGRG